MKRCKSYVGITCIDGHCPKALAEEYAERDMDVIKNCNDCPYYRGCDDCYFFDTEYCTDEERKKYE